MDIVDRYQEQICNMYMKLHPNVNPSRVRELVAELTESQMRNIPCKMHNNMTRELLDTSITNVFNWIETRQPIISGNGTFFKQHEEYLPPIVSMLETLQSDRKRVKKEMWQFDKHSIDYINRNTTQGSIKVIMNADYGGSGTPQSPFFSIYIPPATTQSAKNITTTLICCLEFSSNNSNMWAKLNSINELFDMIFIVLGNEEERDFIQDHFEPDQVAKRLASLVNNLRVEDHQLIFDFVSSLTDSERTKLMLAFNVKFALSRYFTREMTSISNYLKNHPVQFENLTKENIKVSGYGVEMPDEIKDDMDHVSKLILDNCIYPFIPNDCEVRAENMQRIIVCVTDTDSLMVHFSHYLDEFCARVNNFRDSCIIATAIGMRLFVENIIPRFVEYVANGANIKDEYYRKKFVFKNEFAFLAMSLFKKKMYASSMFVQEGTPRDIHDIAVTGLSFKKRDSAEFLEPIMLELYDKYILTTDNISVEGLLDEYYALREKLFKEVRHDTEYYKVLTVKGVEAYDKSKSLPAQMRGTIIWNALMPDEEILPMDRAIVVPLKTEMMLQSGEMRIQKILDMSRVDDPKLKKDIYICLPESYKHIPDWIQPYVDIDVLVDKLLGPFKQILGLFDVVTCDTKGGFVPARMLFI